MPFSPYVARVQHAGIAIRIIIIIIIIFTVVIVIFIIIVLIAIHRSRDDKITTIPTGE